MQEVTLYSAPGEKYLEHILKCEDKFKYIFYTFQTTIVRVINISIEPEELKKAFHDMIVFHDLGKLTKKWQEYLGTNKKLPSHSTIGAVYLWKTLPYGIKEPVSFAVAIHHTDRGLLGDNIEKPDVQAILDGIVDNNGSITWHEKTSELDNDFFPEIARNLSINDIKDMARGLRIWAKGCKLIEQHQRRLQAFLAHHILKLCDISAAVERRDYQKQGDQDYYGGWLMVEEIRRYVNSTVERSKT